jgi:hypothetical protein
MEITRTRIMPEMKTAGYPRLRFVKQQIIRETAVMASLFFLKKKTRT